MKTKQCMIYKDVLEKRLERKRQQFHDLETAGAVSPEDKRKYIELKATINELENCLDIAESMFAHIEQGDCDKE